MPEPEDPPPIISLLEEDIEIGTRLVETGRVRVDVRTHDKPVVVDFDLQADEVSVERRPGGGYLDAMPEVREEDGNLIIPVVEEVIERRLILREEIVIRRGRRTTHVQDVVTSRVQEAVVTRVRAPGSDTGRE